MKILEALKQSGKYKKLVNPEYPNWLFFMFYPVENGLEEINIEGIGTFPLDFFMMAKNENDIVAPYCFNDLDYKSELWEIVA